MNTNERFKPTIGKNVIENLTIGMYDDPRFVYREYVQNAADQIDVAKRQNLYQSESEPSIYIQINADTKTVVIEDNATGIEWQKVLPLLGNIAQSTKNRYEDKGFRGIGRLGGLGYCDKLTFETSFYGETVKSTMSWDAKKLKECISDDNIKIDAAELISIITDHSFDQNESADTHYFKVIMENVTNDILLDVKQVRDYLSMVAPVPFANHFTHRNKIYNAAKEKNIVIDEYNIYVNTDQLFKGYKNNIYENNAISEKDEIIDIAFFDEYYNETLLFWSWYGISKNMNQIPDENKERGFRLRKSNIQIGLETTLDKYHKEKLGNRYFVGEIYAINKELIPNARRDFFIDNNECEVLKISLVKLFANLKKLYYDFSDKNSAFKTIQESEKLIEQLKDKSLNDEEKREISYKLQKKEKKLIKSKKDLLKLANTYQGQLLGEIIKQSSFDYEQQDIHNQDSENKQQTTHSNVDNSNESKKSLSVQEEILLQKVYRILRQNLIKATAEELIQKIEAEIRK
jgi:molecular chaperone HtpG